MVTIDDIAAAAGVSNTTVSNVINGKDEHVSPATARRISRIIEEMGYVPNMSARALVSRTSKVVAMVKRQDGAAGFDDPFTTRFVGAVERTLRESGYYLMLRAVRDADDLTAFVRNWCVDGIFYTGLFGEDELFPALSSIGRPVVLSDSYLYDYGDMVNVGLNDTEGGRLAAKHLTDAGHRRVAFAGAPIRRGGVVERRLEGFKSELARRGPVLDPELVFESEFSTNEAEHIGMAIAAKPGVTAVFATADVLAAGIMSGVRRYGKSVPGDVSVIGFDDINWCRLTYPPLTTVRQDTERKGKIAADSMVTLLEGGKVSERNITLPVRLVERGSVLTIKKED